MNTFAKTAAAAALLLVPSIAGAQTLAAFGFTNTNVRQDAPPTPHAVVASSTAVHASSTITATPKVLPTIQPIAPKASTTANTGFTAPVPAATAPHSTSSATTTRITACPKLSFLSTKIGTTDARTNGQVTVLQKFLANNLQLSSSIVSGTYGTSTAAAMEQFQTKYHLKATGSLNLLTYIKVISVCTATVRSQGAVSAGGDTQDGSSFGTSVAAVASVPDSFLRGVWGSIFGS